MYSSDGENYFIVDGHVHWWDASEENIANEYGDGFIRCFYDYHQNLSPEEYVWPLDKYRKYSKETMVHDLFEEGYVDIAMFLPTYLSDFYVNGFNTIERNGELKREHPDRFILNGWFDPRLGRQGLEDFERDHEQWGFTGVKLYTAEWRGDSKGYKLGDPWAKAYFEKCLELGVTNIHVHKGPTIWPLNRDAFDVADIDDAATTFPDLNFIVEHCGVPRLEDFCWIAVQEPNVYGGLAVVAPFMHTRPRWFAEVLGELLYWVGEDRLLFASDYALWHPKWLVEQFVAFEMPEDMVPEYGEVTPDTKRKILGINAARLYDLEIPDEVPVPPTGEEPAISGKPPVELPM